MYYNLDTIEEGKPMKKMIRYLCIFLIAAVSPIACMEERETGFSLNSADAEAEGFIGRVTLPAGLDPAGYGTSDGELAPQSVAGATEQDGILGTENDAVNASVTLPPGLRGAAARNLYTIDDYEVGFLVVNAEGCDWFKFTRDGTTATFKGSINLALGPNFFCTLVRTTNGTPIARSPFYKIMRLSGEAGIDGVIFKEMVAVTGGSFNQQSSGESYSNSVSGFSIGKYEVSYALWYAVRQWGATNGYTFANQGNEGSSDRSGERPTLRLYEPVTTINWRDAIVWCNAYSEASSLTPVYYQDSERTIPLKNSQGTEAINTTTGSTDNPHMAWEADGFRLPTEGEWQYAASYQNGIAWTHHTWASGASAGTDDSIATKTVAWFLDDGNQYRTKMIGTKKANLLGIHDMSGNAWEWCHDWHAAYLAGTQTDYKGPDTGSNRIRRGGSFDDGAEILGVGFRSGWSPADTFKSFGLRVVRRP
jgi:formylglycine-generating enzyme required for sulfatase activity